MSLTGKCDFTPTTYRKLLKAFKEAGYSFLTFEEYCITPGGKSAVLRHDVDRKPENALKLAEIEANLGIKGSYHFRVAGSSNAPGIIRQIAGLGHEIGYHYEDMTLAAGKKGVITPEQLAAEAFDRFSANLEYFRQFYPVRVISMHGSPTGQIDNRLVWKHFDYRECDIICEPYFDIDFSETLYLTDTGRRWDGERYSIRDKAITAVNGVQGSGFSDWKVMPVKGSLLSMTNAGLALMDRYKIHSTKEIMNLVDAGYLPDRMVINTHPQRWNDSFLPWVWELGAQSVKNHLKKLVIRFRAHRTIN
ncbi:MAG: hypothetical protein RBT50_11045 [Bacteroidales bacterium]|jgi:hypothetical protein|nr:hypothetical protein [Bacteroidales bacterium]